MLLIGEINDYGVEKEFGECRYICLRINFNNIL